MALEISYKYQFLWFIAKVVSKIIFLFERDQPIFFYLICSFRVQKKIFLTETYKYSKVKLGQDGFDPTKCGDDSLYVIDVKNKTYSPFTLKMYASIENGEISL